MYKCVVIFLVSFTIAFGTIAGNFNGDCGVDLEDLAIFANDWLNETPSIADPNTDINSDDIVNYVDFALFAAHWRETDTNCIPQDSNSLVEVTTHLLSEITLNATITGSESLSYIVTSLPATGHLRDTDCTIISSVPKTLRTNKVCFETVTDSNTSFNWKASTGTYDSDGATVTLDVTAHPKDHLSFGKDGIVTIDDADLFDLTGNRGIALFVRTYAADCNMLSKVEPGVGGYSLSMVSGKPTLKLYGSGGLTDTVTYPDAINTGQWYNLGFAYDPNVTNNRIWLGTNENTIGWVNVTEATYSNSEDLTVGNGFWWDIDNIRSYTFTSYTTSIYGWRGFVEISSSSPTQTRQDAGDGNVVLGITIHPVADVRFHCDYDGVNNTTSQIYDDFTNHYTGAINSRRYIRYYPYFIAPCTE